MLRTSRLSVTFCLLTVAALTTACKKNKIAAQPPVAPPTPAAASRPKHRQSVSPPAAAVTSAPVQQPATPPRLGQILSPTQERQFNTAIDQSLSNARSSLNSIGSRGLTREQQVMVQQISDFMQQAQTARQTDLFTAKGLADKADVLARDLVRSLR